MDVPRSGAKTYIWIRVLLPLLAASLFAQQDTGVIAGTAFDPAGSLVQGVAVKVINAGTNQAVSLTTDQNGNFTTPPLRIGVYRVEAEAPGFKKLIEDGIELRLQDRLQIDLHLTVGAVSETIEVTATAPLLQTATS